MFLHIKAKPNSKKQRLEQLPDGRLQLRIHAPAQDGKANEAIVDYLSLLLRIPRSSIQIVSGHSAPFKKIAVDADEAYVKGMLDRELLQ